MNFQRFARHPLTFGPAPIHALPRLSTALGGTVKLYRGSRVLYAHLGGVPALNAYSFLFRNG